MKTKLSLFMVAATVAACNGPPDTEAETGQALIAADASTFFIVTGRDTRRCAYPFCGGYFVKRVNRDFTTCADGLVRPRCHAVELDLAPSGLPADQAETFEDQFGNGLGLVRGRLEPRAIAGGALADILVVDEAWAGQAQKPGTGTHWRLENTGILCITFPCPSVRGAKLNTTIEATFNGVDLASSNAPPQATAAAQDALARGELIAAGTPRPVVGPAGRGRDFVTSELYLRVRPKRTICGTLIGLVCPPDQFCDFAPDAMCGFADQGGVCAQRAQACTKEYNPVCGCDGKTYGNECEAHAAGVDVLTSGICPASQSAR